MGELTDLSGDDAGSLAQPEGGDAESITERIHLALIAAMHDLHRLEEEAATHPRGSERHAALSTAVERQAREVYRLARYQLDRAVAATQGSEPPEHAAVTPTGMPDTSDPTAAQAREIP